MTGATNHSSADDRRPDGGVGTDGIEPDEARPGVPARTWVLRIVVGVIVLTSFAVWGYAFSGQAARDAPDLFEDRVLATDAEAVCAAALADIDELPTALDVTTGAERGRQIRMTTARLERMLDELDELQTSGARDDQIYRDWLADWRVLISDRLNYADAISVDDQAQFLVTNTGVGERLDRRLTRLANTNSMLSCASPNDLG